jgi:hypothetical protein
MLSQGLLNELKAIIKEDFRVEIEPKVLTEVANSFLRYFDLLTKVDN